MIIEKRAIYDHNVDQQNFKWSGETKLKKEDIKFLPEYIYVNQNKFKDWID